MSNHYQSTTKPFPDSHMTTAFTHSTTEIESVEADFDSLDTSHLDEEIDALALLEASIEKPKMTVAPPPVTAPTLPVSPVLSSFPDTHTKLEPVVSQSRPMPELATVAPKSVISEPPKPSITPPSTMTPAPIHGLSLAEGHLGVHPVPQPAIHLSEHSFDTSTSTVDHLVSPARVVAPTTPTTPTTVTITTINEGVLGSTRVTSTTAAPTNSVVTTPTMSEGVIGSARIAGQTPPKAIKAGEGKEVASLEEPAVNILQRVISAYTQLEQSIAANKAELDEVSLKLQSVKEKKQALESKLHEITPPGLPAPLQSLNSNKESVMELDALHGEVKESKINTQNRSCDTVIEYAKSIRKHIVSDSAKAEEFLRPLNLSCEILKTNIQHVRTLEQVVELMEIKKNLSSKRNEVHKTISLLMGQIA